MFFYLIVGPFLKINVFVDVIVALLTFHVIIIWLLVILHFTAVFFALLQYVLVLNSHLYLRNR